VSTIDQDPAGDGELEPNTRASADASGAQPGEIPTHDQEVARLRQQNAQLDDQVKRALADLQNVRRRQRQEMDEARQRTLQDVCQDVLPVLDNFQAALQAWDDGKGAGDPAMVVEGVRMVRSMLVDALARQGVQEIPAASQPFDPRLHEAVMVETRPGVPDGQVLQVLQPGYQIGDRVLRPTRVVVSGPAKT
jgi:molecular chaperone GrpE